MKFYNDYLTFDDNAADYITRYRWGIKQRDDYTERRSNSDTDRDERAYKAMIFSSDF